MSPWYGDDGGDFYRRSGASFPASLTISKSWVDPVDQEVEDIIALVNYLRSRNVKVALFLVPLGSWYRDDFEPSVVYAKQVGNAAEALDVPFLDLSDLLRDDEFFDAAHSNFQGQSKIHPILMDIAWKHLESAGIMNRPDAMADVP